MSEKDEMSNSPERFPQTTDGYKEAIRWLKENGLEHKIQKEQSVDGYTIVTLANKLYNEFTAKTSPRG